MSWVHDPKMFSRSKDATCSKPVCRFLKQRPVGLVSGILDTSFMGSRLCNYRYTILESIHGQLPETKQKTASGAIKVYFKSWKERQGLLPTGLFGLWTLLEHSLPALNISAVSEIKARLLCSLGEWTAMTKPAVTTTKSIKSHHLIASTNYDHGSERGTSLHHQLTNQITKSEINNH